MHDNKIPKISKIDFYNKNLTVSILMTIFKKMCDNMSLISG